jgi:hypothetical protein
MARKDARPVIIPNAARSGTSRMTRLRGFRFDPSR